MIYIIQELLKGQVWKFTNYNNTMDKIRDLIEAEIPFTINYN